MYHFIIQDTWNFSNKLKRTEWLQPNCRAEWTMGSWKGSGLLQATLKDGVEVWEASPLCLRESQSYVRSHKAMGCWTPQSKQPNKTADQGTTMMQLSMESGTCFLGHREDFVRWKESKTTAEATRKETKSRDRGHQSQSETFPASHRRTGNFLLIQRDQGKACSF